MLAGDLEAAFTLFPAGEHDRGLVRKPLIRTDLVLAMSSHHPLARKTLRGLRQLLETPWVMISRPPSVAARVREVFVEKGLAPPARVVQTDSLPVVMELLKSDAFVSVLPREIVHREVREGRFVAKRIPPRTAPAIARMLTREGAVLPGAVDLLGDAVEAERKRMRLQGV